VRAFCSYIQIQIKNRVTIIIFLNSLKTKTTQFVYRLSLIFISRSIGVVLSHKIWVIRIILLIENTFLLCGYCVFDSTVSCLYSNNTLNYSTNPRKTKRTKIKSTYIYIHTRKHDITTNSSSLQPLKLHRSFHRHKRTNKQTNKNFPNPSFNDCFLFLTSFFFFARFLLLLFLLFSSFPFFLSL